MKYDDLLNAPFKHRGRDKNGFDCYGAVLECCRRAGTPLIDVFSDIKSLPAERVNDYIKNGLNVRRIDAPRVGAIVQSTYKGNAHVGYIVARAQVLHATFDNGVKIAPLAAFMNPTFYEVIDDTNDAGNENN
ncbi:MAG: NlpC/P60 family protein [Treponema sp.]